RAPPISRSGRGRSARSPLLPSQSIVTCCWTLSAATAPSSSGTSRTVADSLTNREGEDSAQRSRCQYQLGPRPILHYITENDANQATHSDGGQRVGHAMQGAVRTPMMLGESPHALGTSSHR